MRKETWDIDLFDFIKSRENIPFQWGVHDCALFAADCAKVMTGIDVAEKYRGYTTGTGAASIIDSAGSLRDLVNQNLPEISPKSAKRGDFVLIENEGNPALAVCIGQVAIAAGHSGLTSHPMSEAITAWRIE